VAAIRRLPAWRGRDENEGPRQCPGRGGPERVAAAKKRPTGAAAHLERPAANGKHTGKSGTAPLAAKRNGQHTLQRDVARPAAGSDGEVHQETRRRPVNSGQGRGSTPRDAAAPRRRWTGTGQQTEKRDGAPSAARSDGGGRTQRNAAVPRRWRRGTESGGKGDKQQGGGALWAVGSEAASEAKSKTPSRILQRPPGSAGECSGGREGIRYGTRGNLPEGTGEPACATLPTRKRPRDLQEGTVPTGCLSGAPLQWLCGLWLKPVPFAVAVPAIVGNGSARRSLDVPQSGASRSDEV